MLGFISGGPYRNRFFLSHVAPKHAFSSVGEFLDYREIIIVQGSRITGHCRLGNWRILSCILGVLPYTRFMFHDASAEAGTSRSLSGRVSRNGDKCSLRTLLRNKHVKTPSVFCPKQQPVVDRILPQDLQVFARHYGNGTGNSRIRVSDISQEWCWGCG